MGTQSVHNRQVVMEGSLKKVVSEWEEEAGAVGLVSQERCRVPASTSVSGFVYVNPS